MSASSARSSDSSLLGSFTEQASLVPINSEPHRHIAFQNQDTSSQISAFFLILNIVCGCVSQEQAAMGGNNRQRKSSSGFMSVFNMFKSKKNKGGYYDSYDDGMKARKVWPSDEDRGSWGVAEPGIDIKAEAFIARYRRRVSESERFEIDPAAADAQ